MALDEGKVEVAREERRAALGLEIVAHAFATPNVWLSLTSLWRSHPSTAVASSGQDATDAADAADAASSVDGEAAAVPMVRSSSERGVQRASGGKKASSP